MKRFGARRRLTLLASGDTPGALPTHSTCHIGTQADGPSTTDTVSHSQHLSPAACIAPGPGLLGARGPLGRLGIVNTFEVRPWAGAIDCGIARERARRICAEVVGVALAWREEGTDGTDHRVMKIRYNTEDENLPSTSRSARTQGHRVQSSLHPHKRLANPRKSFPRRPDLVHGRTSRVPRPTVIPAPERLG